MIQIVRRWAMSAFRRLTGRSQKPQGSHKLPAWTARH
jgi:hypothetical protein